MKILKQFKGEDEWYEVTEDKARQTLEQSFTGVDSILEEIAKGFTVYTAFSAFKRGEEAS